MTPGPEEVFGMDREEAVRRVKEAKEGLLETLADLAERVAHAQECAQAISTNPDEPSEQTEAILDDLQYINNVSGSWGIAISEAQADAQERLINYLKTRN